MPFTGKLQLTESIELDGTLVSTSTLHTYTDSAIVKIDEAIADSGTDIEIALVVDVSEIAVVYITSDQALTLEFNNATTGVPTIVLRANEPFIWHTNALDVNLLATDITAVFATNASGSVANLKMRFLYDSTP